MQKVKMYNDGVAEVYTQVKKDRDFRTPTNTTNLGDLENKGKLCFALSSVRIEDMEVAERKSKKLTLKIRVPHNPILKKKDKLVVDNTLYDIFHIDLSSDKTEMFVFMEEERKLA